MFKRIVVFLSIPLLLLSAFAGLLYLHLQQTTDADLAFDIPRGDNLSSIVQRLQGNQSLPVDGAVFKALALLTRDEGPVLAGQYQILQGMTAMDLLALFRSGKVIQYRITFPEGWRLSDWLNAMDDAPYLVRHLKTADKAQVAKVLGFEHDPEGWFFPDTYQYVKGDSDVTILGMAQERMAQVLDEEWSRRGMVSHLESPTDALTLASIIEKETGFEPDRPVVASVFHNRLMTGMRLQSDPTVIYGLGDAFEGDLKRSHLRADTPYNTYTRHGLPPGAICSPGIASIQAALAGSAHDYIYFVAMGEGRSHFSLTLDEHNAAVRKYQLKR